jgi:hypothetical protein
MFAVSTLCQEICRRLTPVVTVTPDGESGTRIKVGVAEIRPEEFPVPEEFVALTDTKYSVLFSSPVNRQLLPLPSVEQYEIGSFDSKSEYATASYPDMADVPVKLGALQLTTKDSLPLKSETFCGAEGVLAPREICKFALPRYELPHEARAT